ncbi:multidrug ABC transporter ATP-binding protein [Lottiidibacillus patelloidae]|uniref:Multidrug ABC transporter ATP-binding protein n=1 Tax=Lottiidibacillus patelloidae TaxID=2670334 RepID=A0A263BVE3_9BACI|nr:ABC transporter ATP-binding protein [Lottiidibacillus patelloidae]OZM57538.1 multidrug ABC transporter ATP-binding protein [Lottiidibacillus patelloidae]
MKSKLQKLSIEQRGILVRLLRYSLSHKKALSIAFVLLFLSTAGQIIGPILIKIFLDDYLTPRNFPYEPLLYLAIGYLGLHLLSVVFNYYQKVMFQKIALKIVQQLRIDVFSKVQRLGLKFFDKTPGGSLVSRITNDTEAIKEMFVSVMSTFVQSGVFLIGIFIGMFYLNVNLALFCLLLIPIIFTIMVMYRYFSSKYYSQMREKLSQLNAKISESLQGMTIIQVFRQEKRLRKEFAKINDDHFGAAIKNMKLDGLLLRPAVDLVWIFSLILVLYYFGMTSLTSAVEIGVLYAFINYLERFFEPVNRMMQQLSIFQQAIVAGGRVFHLLDETENAPTIQKEFQDEKNKASITDGKIEFKDVSFSYDGRNDVLKNITFTANPGETVALVGHTGSGKSSIINLLMRFYAINRGEIKIDGQPLMTYEDEELRTKMGLVLQDPFLFVGDIKQNIRLYNEDITDEDVIRAAKFVQADKFIEKLPNGYEEKVGERGSTFSSGQRQLVSFARTMAINPKILVLDEATASIDTETEELIQVALNKMRKGRTTIAIAHRLSTIQDADQILVLHQGEIVERGNHQELLAHKGLYYKMYLLQQGQVTDKVSANQ